MAEIARSGVPTASEGITGIPLQVVETRDGQVVLEDPDGVNFTVPKEWIEGHDPEKDFIMDHQKLSAAPPGALEQTWRLAKAADEGERGGGGFGGGDDDYQVRSALDEYNIRNSGIQGGDMDRYFTHGLAGVTGGSSPPYKRGKGGSGPGGAWTAQDEAAFVDARDGMGDGSLMASSQSAGSGFANPKTYRKPKNPNRLGIIPPNAGSGWGNADQTWNPRTQRWE
jgi:hypothetical protein